MESTERLYSGKALRSCTSSVCSSPISAERTSYVYKNFTKWPNEWGGVYNESESSDWLSQSVASSTSWSDELEGDLTRSLQDQLKLVENTLYRDGSQQLSVRSPLREECRLWQKNFPHLRSGIRRNLKTSPPVPWSRHGALPPIETTEILSKTAESASKRSASAFFKGGRLNSSSRPNTSLTAAKNQVMLSPLDSLQIRQSSMTTSKQWLQNEHHSYTNCEVLQLKPTDQRQRWRNRSNVLKK